MFAVLKTFTANYLFAFIRLTIWTSEKKNSMKTKLTSDSSQVSNCNGAVLEIYLDHKVYMQSSILCIQSNYLILWPIRPYGLVG